MGSAAEGEPAGRPLIVSDTGPVLHLSETEAALGRLARSSLWLSPRVLREARDAVDKIFEGSPVPGRAEGGRQG